jgi:indoleamine 2,3-dioxygenase
MQWQLHELGFLPLRDPVGRLSDPRCEGMERLAAELPRLVHERAFRDASADYCTAPLDVDSLLPVLDDAGIERLFMLLCYCASAYVHAPGLPPVNRLPAYLARPLVRLAQQVERPPILSYASYCLHNWRRINSGAPVALGNIALLQNFSLPGHGKEDEDWFILVHVDIEARAAGALEAVNSAPGVIVRKDAAAMQALLERTAASLHLMNKTMARMPEGCSPDVYFKKVRPYIFGFNDIVYEGCFNDVPQSYRGETGAQSSIVPTMLAALGIRHKNSLLTKHLEDMLNYMPKPHRQFIRDQVSVREFVTGAGASNVPGQAARLKDYYNACIGELVTFRSKHFDYAVNYIEKKVDNPIATGGTPYVPWLRQLIEETKEYYLT